MLTEKAARLHEHMMSLREGKGREGGDGGTDEMEVGVVSQELRGGGRQGGKDTSRVVLPSFVGQRSPSPSSMCRGRCHLNLGIVVSYVQFLT